METPDVAGLIERGLNLHRAGRLADAEELYKRALDREPGSFDALYLLGVIHLQKGDFHESLARLDAALSVNKSSAFAYNSRGVVLRGMGRWEEALASCHRAISNKPDYAEAYFNRARVLQQMKQLVVTL